MSFLKFSIDIFDPNSFFEFESGFMSNEVSIFFSFFFKIFMVVKNSKSFLKS